MPFRDASVWRVEGKLKSGYTKTGGEINLPIRVSKAIKSVRFLLVVSLTAGPQAILVVNWLSQDQ